ncbi:hypothetical protein K8T06_11685 [bacterium]|nr:hypothetical protein [bacterium]
MIELSSYMCLMLRHTDSVVASKRRKLARFLAKAKPVDTSNGNSSIRSESGQHDRFPIWIPINKRCIFIQCTKTPLK